MGPGEPETAVERRLGAPGREVEIDGAAFGVEARRDGQRLENGGLPGAVLPDEVGDGREAEPVEPLHRRQREGIGVRVLDALTNEDDAPDEGSVESLALVVVHHGKVAVGDLPPLLARLTRGLLLRLHGHRAHP